MLVTIAAIAVIVFVYLWMTTKKNESKEVETTLGCVNGCGFAILGVLFVILLVFLFDHIL